MTKLAKHLAYHQPAVYAALCAYCPASMRRGWDAVLIVLAAEASDREQREPVAGRLAQAL